MLDILHSPKIEGRRQNNSPSSSAETDEKSTVSGDLTAHSSQESDEWDCDISDEDKEILAITGDKDETDTPAPTIPQITTGSLRDPKKGFGMNKDMNSAIMFLSIQPIVQWGYSVRQCTKYWRGRTKNHAQKALEDAIQEVVILEQVVGILG